jgi:hypothetical protein
MGTEKYFLKSLTPEKSFAILFGGNQIACI